jgi:uncharacterized protein (DUF1697 family)
MKLRGNMGIHIALLRGVNVGGKGIVAMSELKAAFIRAGFYDATTYINSGNVLFSSTAQALELQSIVRRILLADFAIDTPVAVLAAEELSAALAKAPAWWGQAAEDRHNTIFVIPPATAETVSLAVGPIKPAYEQLAWHGQVIFWSAPMPTFSRTRWGSVSKLPIYREITIRNRNTALKLEQLARGMGGNL